MVKIYCINWKLDFPQLPIFLNSLWVWSARVKLEVLLVMWAYRKLHISPVRFYMILLQWCLSVCVCVCLCAHSYRWAATVAAASNANWRMTLSSRYFCSHFVMSASKARIRSSFSRKSSIRAPALYSEEALAVWEVPWRWQEKATEQAHWAERQQMWWCSLDSQGGERDTRTMLDWGPSKAVCSLHLARKLNPSHSPRWGWPQGVPGGNCLITVKTQPPAWWQSMKGCHMSKQEQYSYLGTGHTASVTPQRKQNETITMR